MHINDIRQRPDIEAWLDKQEYRVRRLGCKCIGADGEIYYSCDWNPIIVQTDFRSEKVCALTGIAKQSRIIHHEDEKRWYAEKGQLYKNGEWSKEDKKYQKRVFDHQKYGVGEQWRAKFGRGWVEASRVDEPAEMLKYASITSTHKDRANYTDRLANRHLAVIDQEEPDDDPLDVSEP
jgi:hypothetical protein